MIAKTVHIINEKISENLDLFPCLKCYKLFGLAEHVVLRDSYSDRWIPYVIDRNSEDTDVWIDDDISLGIYHRLLSKNYSTPERKSGYGDYTLQNVHADMILVCWAFRKNFSGKSNVDTLERLIYSSVVFNKGESQTIAVNSNFDRKSVFNGEFSGVPFNLPEDVMLFSMRYKIIYPVTTQDCTVIENICKDGE